MSINASFFTMLQITDSIFPIGSYTQSNGLETYVQKGIVKDRETADEYLRSVLVNSYIYSDFLAVKLAYEYSKDMDIERLIELDETLCAVKAPREMKDGSSRLCGRFLKLVTKFSSDELIYKYKTAIEDGKCYGQHSIAYGSFSAVSNIAKEDAIKAYMYNTTSAIINNCAKLIPLGQVDGQTILFEMQNLLQEIFIKLDSLDVYDLGRCCAGFDIRAMQHEDLYSRLYMS